LSFTKKTLAFLILFFSLFFIIYIFINNIINRDIVKSDTYYLLKKNTSNQQILYELTSKKIDINWIDWKLSSLLHKNVFIPKAGEYLISKNLSIFEIQKLFQNGKTITRKFTLIEGATASELKKNLINNPYLTGNIENLKEGIYKPDTYFFKYGYARKKLLAEMEKAQKKLLDIVWKAKPKSFILKNKNELLILASIIQKETSHIDDSELVASVFINRLKKNMKLQSDVTLSYGLKVNGTKITKKMLRSKHPFNTYYFHGLPPTPISYPGKNAINSLKNIKKTDYLYFVTDGKGRHRFSSTYSLHKKNINLWKSDLIKDR